MATTATKMKKASVSQNKPLVSGNRLSRFQSELPTYNTTLPVNGENVKFSPMTVKQRRALSMAVSTGTTNDAIDTLLGIIKDCCGMTDDETANLSATDIEWLLLQIHIKSSGETIDVKVKCPKCEETTATSIDLSTAKCDIPETGTSNTIELGNDVVLRMTWPNVATQRAVALINEDKSLQEDEKLIRSIACMITSIECKDDVEFAADVPFDDLVEFVDGLNEKNLLQLKDFFDASPQVIIPIHVVCSACGHETFDEMTGIESFFG